VAVVREKQPSGCSLLTGQTLRSLLHAVAFTRWRWSRPPATRRRDRSGRKRRLLLLQGPSPRASSQTENDESKPSPTGHVRAAVSFLCACVDFGVPGAEGSTHDSRPRTNSIAEAIGSTRVPITRLLGEPPPGRPGPGDRQENHRLRSAGLAKRIQLSLATSKRPQPATDNWKLPMLNRVPLAA